MDGTEEDWKKEMDELRGLKERDGGILGEEERG